MKHLTISVSGKVQGVFFRANTREVAENLSIRGYVKNLEDGRVYIEAEGEPAQLDSFLEWVKKGPIRARVEEVEVREGTVTGYTDFEIRRT